MVRFKCTACRQANVLPAQQAEAKSTSTSLDKSHPPGIQTILRGFA